MHIIKIIKKHIIRPFYSLKYLKMILGHDNKLKISFLSSRECLREITIGGKSLIRMGDGEVGFLIGDSVLEYQKYSKKLKKEILTIIKNYDEDSRYILAVPKFISFSKKRLLQEKIFMTWMPFRVLFVRYFNRQAKYADAHTFYKNNFLEYFHSYFKNKKIVFITNKYNMDNITKKWRGNNRFYKVIASSVNAYEEVELIIKRVDYLAKSWDKNQFVLCISLGPAAKSLVYHYANKGIQAYDLGKGINYI